MSRGRYEDPVAFRQALSTRLRQVAQSRSLSIQEVQLKLLMERLLARLFATEEAPWTLKGGYAMELRYRPMARTTRDLDLTVHRTAVPSAAETAEAIREALQNAASMDLADHFEFLIGSPHPGSERVGGGAGGGAGGRRFPVEARLAGKVFGRFHVDVGVAEPSALPEEDLLGDDLLAFADIAPARVRVIAKPGQFAEKVHAYSYPWRDRENTRVKDLVDLVLLIDRGELVAGEVVRALHETFSRRNTHPLPAELEPPPSGWAQEFAAMASRAGLHTDQVDAAFLRLSGYWNSLPFG